MPMMQTRRRFLTTLSLAGAAGLVGPQRAPAAEGALETATVRIANVPGICIAPQYVAEELLRAEGFTDVRYVRLAPGSNSPEGIARGEVDFGINFASVLVAGLDRGVELTVLGGVHVGCFELFVNDGSRSLTELKGKRVGITFRGSPGHLFLAAIAAHVGIDPARICTGSRANNRPGRSSSSPQGRSKPSWAFRPTHSSCAASMPAE
jgi:NitT/TauT family transport system substrate-binding protein